MDNRKKSFATNSLRRASYRWPGRYQAVKAAHVGRNQYICAHCPPEKVHTRKEIQLDHVVPCVDPKKGWQGFDDFIDRLLVDTSGFQVLCREHHQIKTSQEGVVRKQTVKKKKTSKNNT